MVSEEMSMSSSVGEKLKISVFGESHGEAIGCVVDGLPAGIKLDMDAIYKDMLRRAPGRDRTSTPRLEKDIPSILSGVLDGVTTGAPLAMIIENTNTKHIIIQAQSQKYEQLGYFKAILKTQGILSPSTVVSSVGERSGEVVKVRIEGDLP